MEHADRMSGSQNNYSDKVKAAYKNHEKMKNKKNPVQKAIEKKGDKKKESQ